MFFFFKQKTAYEMRISDWSSDVCSSDLHTAKSCNKASACALARVPTTRGRGVGAPAASRPDVEGNTALNAKVLRLILALVPLGAFVLEIGRASCRERVCQYV